MYLQAGSAGELGQRHGLEQVGFWQKLLEHPGYDAFWKEQAVDRILAAQPLNDRWSGTLLAGGHWQQRKDVDEVSKPQPPSGPATPVPYCSPGSPICP